MWEVWIQAKTYHRPPNEVFEPNQEEWQGGGRYGSILRYSFNAAVTWFGITIENALNERVEVRMGPTIKSNPRYTLARLLHPNFRLMRPAPKIEDNPNPMAALLSLVGKPGSGVRRYKYVPPV